MAQANRPCDGCGQLIARTAQVAPIRHYCSPDCRPRCSVDGCEKPRHGLTYCSKHHTRWRKTGDALTPLVRHPNVGVCGVEGCDQPMRKTGWCASHYEQFQKTGEVKPFIWKWGDGGYIPTHTWLRRKLGLPSDRACVDCGGPAAEWSYNHNDPDELLDDRGIAYTRKIECYSPRCVLCHRRYDRQLRRKP